MFFPDRLQENPHDVQLDSIFHVFLLLPYLAMLPHMSEFGTFQLAQESAPGDLQPHIKSADLGIPEMRVFEAMEPFLLYCKVERQYSPESQVKMKEAFDSWLLRHFGRLEIRSIRLFHILAFRQAMTAKELSVARQYSLLMTLKLFLKFCRVTLEINCLDPASIKLPRRQAPNVQYLTNDEIRAIRSNIDTFPIAGVRLRALFETLLSTGMRISEAVSLDRDSINSETKEATVIGKGSKARTVFFSDEALRWINRYLSRRKDNNSALFVTYGDDSKRLRRGDIPRFLKAVGKLAGIEKHVTPHLLRHTFCTNLRNHGADISLIKELAGHQDIQTTARYYLGVNKKVLRDTVSRYLDYSTPDSAADSGS
jgi:site-specific recombinase XerD